MRNGLAHAYGWDRESYFRASLAGAECDDEGGRVSCRSMFARSVPASGRGVCGSVVVGGGMSGWLI